MAASNEQPPPEHLAPDEADKSAGEPKPRCPNCDKKMPREAKFCPKCGQKRQDGLPKLSELLERVWRKAFHVDNKFFRMSWQLLIPARVTQAYFNGRIKSYPDPIQFFFICMFLLLVYVHNTAQKGPVFIDSDLPKEASFEVVRGRLDQLNALNAYWDSLPPDLQTPQSRVAFDSLVAGVSADLREWREDSVDLTGLSRFSHAKKIALQDLLLLTPDSLIAHYGLHGFLEQMLIRQSLKSIKDPERMGRFWLGMMAWTLLFQIAVMSLWLKLLYVNHNRYFVEHFVFLLHLHSGFILFLTLTGFLRKVLGMRWLPQFLPVVWFTGAALLGMYWFYRQGKLKTMLKWLLFGFLYVITFLVMFSLSFVVSFLLF